MKPFLSPFDAWRVMFDTTRMLAEAQGVIAMRTLGMAGLWNVTPAETTRMVAEKVAAAQEAALAATLAAMRGAHPARVMAAATKPVAARVRANRARLARRGLTGKS